VKLALAGDRMLGRGVAERLPCRPLPCLFSDELVAVAAEADLFLLNLECAISARGQRWPDPRKSFFCRAPPVAVDVLRQIGVSCVTLVNNALDFGVDALFDTCDTSTPPVSATPAPVSTSRPARRRRSPAERARASDSSASPIILLPTRRGLTGPVSATRTCATVRRRGSSRPSPASIPTSWSCHPIGVRTW
jgi:Bacterial capsule synthesis protein PGA_cap